MLELLLLEFSLSCSLPGFDYRLPCDMTSFIEMQGARCGSVVKAFAHSAMGRRIDPSWDEPTELFLVPASAPRLV